MKRNFSMGNLPKTSIRIIFGILLVCALMACESDRYSPADLSDPLPTMIESAPGIFDDFVLIRGVAENPELRLLSSEGAYWILENDESILRFKTTRNGEWMRIEDDGDVGIGTDSPKANLHVHDRGGLAEIRLSPDGNNGFALFSLCQDSDCDLAAQLRYDGDLNSFYLYFKNRSGSGFDTARDRIALKVEHHANSAARIGINVPKEHDIKKELEVNGKILAEEVEVVANVADYVFNDDFHLMTLDKLNTFITENHHLPGIPSKSDVVEQGGILPVGQALTQMLQKIEELTLYTIEQHTTLKNQDKLLRGHQKEMQEMQEEIRSLRKMLLSNEN